MNEATTSIDWSATAAWIALVISVIGTVASPLITTILANRHQHKMRKLDIEEQVVAKYDNRRYDAINNFLISAGYCLALPNRDSVAEFGKSYSSVHQFVPKELWLGLDEFYQYICDKDYEAAQFRYPDIIHSLSELLKEAPQLNQSK